MSTVTYLYLFLWNNKVNRQINAHLNPLRSWLYSSWPSISIFHVEHWLPAPTAASGFISAKFIFGRTRVVSAAAGRMSGTLRSAAPSSALGSSAVGPASPTAHGSIDSPRGAPAARCSHVTPRCCHSAVIRAISALVHRKPDYNVTPFPFPHRAPPVPT